MKSFYSDSLCEYGDSIRNVGYEFHFNVADGPRRIHWTFRTLKCIQGIQISVEIELPNVCKNVTTSQREEDIVVALYRFISAEN